ncbi:type II/IV secretion system protein [Candidatus Poribacteria bacterium]|nr:type II/IV secretion system protein [Candidatus Poribacteria bacterium]
MKTQETQARKNFAEFLVEKNILLQGQIEYLITEIGRSPAGKIREILLERNLVHEEELYAAWAEYHHLPYINLRLTTFDQQALAAISSEVARQNVLIPFRFYPGEISVAFDDVDINIVNQLKQKTRCNILAHIATRSHILEAIEVQYGAIDIQVAAGKVDLSQYSSEMLGNREIADTKPIVDIANGIIIDALKHRASDIHLEPREYYLQIRFRIDGVIYEKFRLARAITLPLISRYKIMANLNIAERRKPQDGRLQYNIGERRIDIRMSVIPTTHGEKIVLRILDKSRVNLDIRQMFFPKQIYRQIERIISWPHGAFFVTGPTGSGKTTTLYAILNHINSVEKNIVTLEDPIEYRLPLINQIQIKSDIGLDFATVLRSVLRQDPDVILIGEIRDLETAKIATEAALTGHLVLSTLHTNNAIDAVIRLVEIGVEPFMVAPSLIGMLAQRLVRRICQKCQESYVASAEERSYFGLNATGPMIKLYRGKGCPSCLGTGYFGRIAIYELAIVTNEIRELILQQAQQLTVAEAAYKTGYRSMRFDGFKKVLRGLTTLSEVLRVTIAQEDVLGE